LSGSQTSPGRPWPWPSRTSRLLEPVGQDDLLVGQLSGPGPGGLGAFADGHHKADEVVFGKADQFAHLDYEMYGERLNDDLPARVDLGTLPTPPLPDQGLSGEN